MQMWLCFPFPNLSFFHVTGSYCKLTLWSIYDVYITCQIILIIIKVFVYLL